MHERYGLVQHAKDLAERCARDGYVVLAPNFFYRHPDQKVLNAGDSRYDLTDPESVELLQAAVAALKKVSAADLSSRGRGNPHEGENIEVVEVPLATLYQMARQGTIEDAKTLIIVQRLMLEEMASPAGR